MSAGFAVEAQGVTKRYGTKTALNGISIGIEHGKIHVLLGRNGSGKTTLAKVLAGIMSPDSGIVSPNGAKGGACDPAYRRKVGFLFDSSVHWDSLTGFENAWFFARAYGLDPKQARRRIELLFGQLSLTEASGDPVSTYSFGMKRKLALVEALVHEPALLILDEPSIGLDYASRITIYSLLRARAGQGLSIVIATNDMNEARYLADTVSMIEKGRVLITGAPDELIKSLDQRTLIQIELEVPADVSEVERIPGVLGASMLEGQNTRNLQVLAASVEEPRVTSELLAFLSRRGIGFSKLEFRRPELGDVFLKFVRSDQP